MNYTQDNDKLYRYFFQNRAVRGEWVRLNQTFTDTLNTHHYPKAVQNLLGEMMVVTNLLTATLKFNGNITVQIQGDGPLKLALVNGNDQQQIRALARVQGDIQDGMSLHDMIGKGVLVIGVTDVVAADKADLTIDHEDLAVILAGAPDVQREKTRAQCREATHVQVRHRRERVETRILVENPETVPDAEHLDAALGGTNEGLLETLAPSVRPPNERLEINVMLCAFDGLQHVPVQRSALGIRAHNRVADDRVGGRQGRETVHATGNAGSAHAVDRVHGHDCCRLGGDERESHFLHD